MHRVGEVSVKGDLSRFSKPAQVALRDSRIDSLYELLKAAVPFVSRSGDAAEGVRLALAELAFPEAVSRELADFLKARLDTLRSLAAAFGQV